MLSRLTLLPISRLNKTSDFPPVSPFFIENVCCDFKLAVCDKKIVQFETFELRPLRSCSFGSLLFRLFWLPQLDMECKQHALDFLYSIEASSSRITHEMSLIIRLLSNLSKQTLFDPKLQIFTSNINVTSHRFIDMRLKHVLITTKYKTQLNKPN